MFQDNCLFDKHIASIAVKANKLLGSLKFLCHRISGASAYNIINIYKSHIRPIMEYGICVWGRHSNIKLRKIESVQHRALTYALGVPNCAKNLDMLKCCNLWPIAMRKDYHLLNFFRSRKGLPEHKFWPLLERVSILTD